METLYKLKTVTILMQEEEGLPDFLAQRIFTIIELLQATGMLQDDLQQLCEQVAQYDTFGQTGYCGMGVDNLILEESIKRLELRIKEVL
jgi:hypothetical protein